MYCTDRSRPCCVGPRRCCLCQCCAPPPLLALGLCAAAAARARAARGHAAAYSGAAPQAGEREEGEARVRRRAALGRPPVLAPQARAVAGVVAAWGWGRPARGAGSCGLGGGAGSGWLTFFKVEFFQRGEGVLAKRPV